MPDEPGAGAHTFQARLRGLAGDPAVPLLTIRRWLDELGHRYQQQRFSPRPVLVLRALLALDLGETAAASAHLAAAMAMPWDATAGCPACESENWGRWRAALGDDWGALEYWAPVLDGRQRCAEQPDRVLGRALLPLTQAGLLDQARDAHLRGYPLVRGQLSQQAAVGQHLEFCALTGNETRGLEIAAEHAGWLTGPEVTGPGSNGTGANAASWLEFAVGACVLLRRLTGLGQGSAPLGPGTIASRLALVEQEIQFLCDRFDVRNGTTTYREQVNQRLSQPPLASELPLQGPPGAPLSVALPSDLDLEADLEAEAAIEATPPEPDASLADLVARARQLRDDRHPHTRQAWEEVAASGQDLPADVAAELDRQRAGALAETDPRAGREALLAAAGQFAGLGDEARACEARAAAAMARAQAGDAAGAATALAAAIADAEAAFTRGAFTPQQYLIVRRARPLMAMQALTAAPPPEPDQGPDPAALADLAELSSAELSEAERLGVPRYAANYHDLLAQLARWGGAPEQARAHLETARRLYLGTGEPWNAARAGSRLAQLALASGDTVAAEQLARESLGHGGTLLPPRQIAGLRLLLADAVGAQPGRPREAAGQVRQAAELYAELGDVVNRVRCLRTAAWLEFSGVRADREGDAAAGRAGVAAMTAVLAELIQLQALAPEDEDGTGFLAEELGATRSQLDAMQAELDSLVPEQA